jgi:hypothetical protein
LIIYTSKTILTSYKTTTNQILQQASNITANNKLNITTKYQTQPGFQAHFSAIYQSRPMAKYQSQPIKVSRIIENHRLRSEEPKSTQTPDYNYYYNYKATTQQDNK